MKQRGFTLLEMLIVVAIIGIIAGIAAVMLDPRPRADDAAQVVAALAREAAREAVSRGDVRDDVAAAAGTARSRLLVSAADDRVTVSVEVLIERALPSSDYDWVEVGRDEVGPGVTLAGWSPRAVLDGGSTPDSAGPIEIDCHSDGVCDGATIYFTSAHRQRSRVAILPLGGAPMTYLAW